MLNDGSKPLYPRNNSILKNHIHDYGVFGKQTSCVYISLSASTLVSDNVGCNGPRAHIKQNDGFTLIFELVAGPYNSCRHPYWTSNGVKDGLKRSQHIKDWDTIQKN